MTDAWFAGNFCPHGATCSIDKGELNPSVGPAIRTLSGIDLKKPAAGVIQKFSDGTPLHTDIQWTPCNGQLLSIEDFTNLFSTLGTQYGGDGRFDFAMPNLKDKPNADSQYYICLDGPFAPHY